MSLSRQDKEQIITEISELIKDKSSLIVAEYRGLSVELMTALRVCAREEGICVRVLKNTLARKALEGSPLQVLSSYLTGPLVYGFSSDPVALSRVFCGFAKKSEHFVVKSGVAADRLLLTTDIDVLATLPTRPELLSILLRTMQAPVSAVVRTLNEIPARFVRTLSAVCEKRS